jgi:hypothetical protein
MRRFTLVTALALLVAPTALAGPAASAADKARAAKSCQNVKAAIGPGAFKQLFAPNTHNARAAARNCARRETAFQHANRENPEWKQACEEMRPPPGDPPTNASAYGQCVANLARQKAAEHRQNTIAAALECKAERRNPNFATEIGGGKTFAELYGTNENHRNAFARCVAQKRAAAEQPTP